MATVTISAAGDLGAAEATDRIPASRAGTPRTKGYLTAQAIVDFSIVKRATVSLNAARLNTLFSNSPVIVPAPGAGKANLYLGGSCKYTFVTTDFELASGAGRVHYEDAAGLTADTSWGVFNTPFSFFGESAYEYSFGQGSGGVQSTPGLVKVENLPLVYATPADASVPGDGSAVVTVYYIIEDL